MLDKAYRIIIDQNNRWQWWFWGIIILMAPAAAVIYGDQTIIESLVFRVVGLVSKILAAYFIAYYLVPETLYKRRYLLFFVAIPPTIFFFTLLARFLNVQVAEVIFYSGLDQENLWFIIKDWQFTIQTYFDRVFISALWFTFIKYGIDNFRSKEKVNTLIQEKAQAELRLLKAQIHPHFLFNTLNNLYSLTVEKSDQAPEVVERLSEMLDYQLYQCNTPKVAVRKEIELLENYIQLESLRYGKRLRLSFEHSVDDPGAQIAPLILISPVENAFKHGASGNADSPFIEIQLNVTAGMLYFNVRNNKPPIAITDHTEYTEGIGLNNIRKQLRLLYPDQHVLTIEETEQEFHLSLVITL